MSITVVTTRGYDGAPTTRDVYADGVRYRVGDSNLEVYSDQSQLLAFYGSGNWQSVLVDDPVLVHTGPPDPSVYAGMPLASDHVPAGRGAAARRAPAAEQAPPADVPRTPVALQQRPRPDARPSAPVEPVDEPTPVDPAAASAQMLARSPSMRRVRFAPKTYRAARAGVPAAADATSRSRSTSLRPVVFRPKIYRAARGTTEAEVTGSEVTEAQTDGTGRDASLSDDEV